MSYIYIYITNSQQKWPHREVATKKHPKRKPCLYINILSEAYIYDMPGWANIIYISF